MILIIYSIIVTLILVFFVFYIRYLLQQLLFFAENIDDLREEVEEYSVHLKSLFEMTIFHGDETIEGMIGHTSHVLKKIEDFEEFYSHLLSEPDPESEEEQSDQEENPTQKDV